jgi:hypothetical protein
MRRAAQIASVRLLIGKLEISGEMHVDIEYGSTGCPKEFVMVLPSKSEQLGSPSATSAPGLGSPLPHLRRDWACPLPQGVWDDLSKEELQ